MTNQPTDIVIGMDLDPIVSQGLGDRDERFPVHTPPMTDTIIIQPPPIEISHEPPITDSTISPNEKSTETSSEEMNMNITNDPSKQIILPSLLIKNEENSNDSRDQFVKVLTKEAFTSQSPTSTLSVSPRRRSSSDEDENENQSDTNEPISSTRTVILVSNNEEDNLIIKTTNPNSPEEPEEEEESEPTVKRIKVDLISPATDPDKNTVNPSGDDHDYRHDLDERRQSEEKSRSHTSSNRESNSKSLPSKNHHYKPTPPPPSSQRRYESNRSYPYQQRSKPNLSRHQRFNYNHQSVADHQRFSQSSSSTNLNYQSFSTSTYSQNQK